MISRFNLLFTPTQDLSFDLRFISNTPDDPPTIGVGELEVASEVDGDDADLFHFVILAADLQELPMSVAFQILGGVDQIAAGTMLSRKYQSGASGTTVNVDPDTGGALVSYTSGGVTINEGGGGGSGAVYERVDLAAQGDIVQQGGTLDCHVYLDSIATPTDDPDFWLWSWFVTLVMEEGSFSDTTVTIRVNSVAALVPSFASISPAAPFPGVLVQFSIHSLSSGATRFGFLDSYGALTDFAGSPITAALTPDDVFVLSGSALVTND